jgi:MOSC domain-containing protein YiiM
VHVKILTVSTGPVAPLLVPVGAGGVEAVASAIRKSPVSTHASPKRIAVGGLGLDGDEQADHSVHGGPQKAVYAYPVEHYAVWQTIRKQATTIDEPLPHGFLGENLTVEGLAEGQLWIGDLLVRDGLAPEDRGLRFRVTSPRYPCFKFNARMGFPHASKMMAQSGYCGFYLEVLEPGTIAAGDAFRLVQGPREVTIDELFRLKMGKKTL